ncbi:5'/3'-nucleotidase SurE [Pseudomonas aeruginosa]|uniref:5'/3'-nucleotidase SurE n=1 Tax=Pseudomonas aeruginosa TaxID=287 RepID=UPI0021A8E6F4|nr:5'/3'-nucleotidase SurE [Pseudomonas aeruginosa]EJB8386469.1 5'/3'-nucleotidase SurE [Pseudomonas aeruginosa]MCT2414798.1 5'/3'-nucleotidase SurE [Pseudomonas aeruginosa]HBO3777800.1 5'/3'-nucleotidase SurE [Pseudomonas aeruginosa]
MRSPLPLLALGCALAQPAFALNILLSNDDGYRHPNIRALYAALKADGHNVRIAAPYSDQSARGGAFFFGRETRVGRDDDPAYPDSYYLTTTETGICESADCAGRKVGIRISATPVMAVLLGLDKILPNPDLVIVGPNPGNNLGPLNSASGTFNAASVALLSGVPALAVSVDLEERDSQRVAAIVARLVAALARQRQAGGALLPRGVGLNLNLPPLEKLQGARLTRIGSYVPFHARYSDDLGPFDAKLAGKPGIGFAWSPPPGPGNAEDEAVWVARGYLTLSPFNALPGTPDASEGLAAMLTPLLGQHAAKETTP